MEGHARLRRKGVERDVYPWLIFVLLLAVYLLFYSGQFHSSDEESILSMSESLVKRAWFDTPQRVFAIQIDLPITQETVGVDGLLYSKRGWVWPLCVAPFYALSLWLPRLSGIYTAHLASAVITALTGSVTYLCGRSLGLASRPSLWGALSFGLGSISLVYAKFLFSEPFIGLMLALSLLSLLQLGRGGRWHWAAWAGLGLGLAGAARLSTLSVGPVLAVYLVWYVWRHVWRSDRRQAILAILAFGAAVLLPTAMSGAYNWIRFGSVWQSGYTSGAEGFTTPLWTGLYGLLLSPGKGFFWFSPVLLLAFPGSMLLWRTQRSCVLLVWGLFVTTLLTYAVWYMWWGGSAWGPRFLVPVTAPLAVLAMPLFERPVKKGTRWWVWGLFGLGAMVQVLGATVNFLHYGAMLVEIDPRAEWTLAVYDIRYQPIWGHLRFLQAEHLDLAWLRLGPDGWRCDGGFLFSAALLLAVGLAGFFIKTCRRLFILVPAAVMVVLVGQFCLSASFLDDPVVRDWQAVYGRIAGQSQRQDRIFVQDSHGAQLGFALDKSRIARYNWSPRSMPLDAATEKWLAWFDGARTWLVSGSVAQLDRSRGIERWFLERGAKLIDVEHATGPRLLFFERTPPLDVRSVDLDFGDQVSLSDYASSRQTTPGEAIHLALGWKALSKPDFAYSVFVHLVDAQGNIVAQADGSPVGGLSPMNTWQEGQVIQDRYGFLLPADMPSGLYTLRVGLYRWDTLVRLPIADRAGHLVGDVFELEHVQVGGVQ